MVLMLSEYGCRTVKVLPDPTVWSLAEQLTEDARAVELVFRCGEETSVLEDTLSLREEYGITQKQAVQILRMVLYNTAETVAEGRHPPGLLDLAEILEYAIETEVGEE